MVWRHRAMGPAQTAVGEPAAVGAAESQTVVVTLMMRY